MLEQAEKLGVPLLVYRDGVITETQRTALTDEFVAPGDIARDIVDNRIVVNGVKTITDVWADLLDSDDSQTRAPLDLFRIWVTQSYGIGLPMSPYKHDNIDDVVDNIVREVIAIAESNEEK